MNGSSIDEIWKCPGVEAAMDQSLSCMNTFLGTASLPVQMPINGSVRPMADLESGDSFKKNCWPSRGVGGPGITNYTIPFLS